MAHGHITSMTLSTTKHTPLDLFARGSSDQTVTWELAGRTAEKLCRTSLTHTVHLHAQNALKQEILRHPIQWSKQSKQASIALTPDWAYHVVHNAVHSIAVLGYFAYRVRGECLEVAPVCALDIMYMHGQWRIKANKGKWIMIMVTPPHRHAGGGCQYSSAAQAAEEDTKIYDEMYLNVRKRDHFNSTPSCFTTIDPQLKNQGVSSKQWFQQATAGDAAANRGLSVSIDSNFQSLVQNRATSIQRLGEQSSLARERLNAGGTKLAGETETLEDATTNMQHTEHIVTDGREVQSTRSLMSLTDGYQVVNNAMFNIFFHFRVPPQILGKNVNAERTGVNPRLNEVVLSAFFAYTTHLRTVIGRMFADLTVAGATLQFRASLSPYELSQVGPKLNTGALMQLYATAYNVPSSYFDEKRIRDESDTTPAFKRTKPELAAKRAQVTGGKPVE